MRRTVMQVSLRKFGQPSDLPGIGATVGAALGCQFSEGSFNTIPALITELLGLRLGISAWRGVGDRVVIRMESHVAEERLFAFEGDAPPDVESVDISAAVADLLEVRGAGRWHLPSASEIAAETAYGEELDRDFLTTPTDGLRAD